MKKNILLTGGGTAISWHISQICHKYFNDFINLFVCDINDKIYVPASIYAKKYFKVPYAYQNEYLTEMKDILIKNKIDIIIPIIPEEALLFASDSLILKNLGIVSSAPKNSVFKILSDKYDMFHMLKKLEIPTPMVYEVSSLKDNILYFVKPRIGFGSNGIGKYFGSEIKENISEFGDKIIQEYCKDSDYREVTVEVFNDKDKLHVFARERVSVKSGVCVKMKPVNNDEFYPIVRKLVSSLECPYAFNLQFLYHNNQWKLFDCNLRLGAGTSLATSIGFQLTRAMIAKLLGLGVNENWFIIDSSVKSVLRVYDEVVIR